MVGGRECFFLCMTLSATDAHALESDDDATTTMRDVCRMRREEPVAFHEIWEHILTTTENVSAFRRSLSPVDADAVYATTAPAHGETLQRVRDVITGPWLTVDQVAQMIGSKPRTIRDALCRIRRTSTVEHRWQTTTHGRVQKAYRIKPQAA